MFVTGQRSGFPSQISPCAVRRSCVLVCLSTPSHKQFFWALSNPGLNTQMDIRTIPFSLLVRQC